MSVLMLRNAWNPQLMFKKHTCQCIFVSWLPRGKMVGGGGINQSGRFPDFIGFSILMASLICLRKSTEGLFVCRGGYKFTKLIDQYFLDWLLPKSHLHAKNTKIKRALGFTVGSATPVEDLVTIFSFRHSHSTPVACW